MARTYQVPPNTAEKEKAIGGMLTFSQFGWLILGLIICLIIFAIIFLLCGDKVVGIICGAGIFDIAVIMSLVITVMLFGLDLLPVRKASMLLIVNSKDINVEDSVNKVLKKYATNSVVKSRSVSKNGVDLIIELKTNKGAELVDECCKIEGLLNVNLLSHDGERKF